MTIVKNTKILVNVEEALADMLVVTYTDDNKKFQGVLLDSTKGNLPFGVYGLHPAFNKQADTGDTTDDRLYSTSQRFAYQETQYAKKPISRSKTNQKQKMTVRLRPRKVLCSNCQSICNENNENVDVSSDKRPKRVELKNSTATQLAESRTLIPRLSRLRSSEIAEALEPKQLKQEIIWTDPAPIEGFENEVGTGAADGIEPNEPAESRMLPTIPRTLKICFGVGEGTVVTLPTPKEMDDKAERRAKRRAERAEAIETTDERKRKRKRKRKRHPEDSDIIDSESVDDEQRQKKLSISVQEIEKIDCVADEGGTEIENGNNEETSRVRVGDIVWGKVCGWPWWPGRVLGLAESGARVAWYASTTCSLMPQHDLSPFLRDYKMRFNKKKRGIYKDAVRQAVLEATRIENGDSIDTNITSNSGVQISTLSPRSIDVLS